MHKIVYRAGLYIGLVLCSLTLTNATLAAESGHQLALQITDNDPARMEMLLHVADNVVSHYHETGEKISIRVVAFGPGLMMLRDDASPVRAHLLAFMADESDVEFDACNNTLQAMAKKEGKVPPLVAGVKVVPSGAVALLELSERGWTILRP